MALFEEDDKKRYLLRWPFRGLRWSTRRWLGQLNDYGLETPPDDASAQATQQDNMMGSRGSVVSHISDVAEKEELGRNATR